VTEEQRSAVQNLARAALSVKPQQALRLALMVIGMLLAWQVDAQRPGRIPGQGQNSGFQDTVPQGDVLVDTFPIFSFSGASFYREQVFDDTLLSVAFRQNEPTRRRRMEYRHLGVNGSPARPLFYESTWRRGLDVGFHQFDVYRIDIDSVKHYRLEKPYTQAAYNTGGEQANGYFTAKFSRDFANGLNFSLDYRRLAYLGTRTLFPDQNVRNTSLGLGFWIQTKAQRYQAFISMASNRFDLNNNGGIAEGPDEEGDFSTPGSAEVFLDETGTRYSQTDVRYAHFFRLGKVPEFARQEAPPQRPTRRIPGIQRDSLGGRADSLTSVAPPVQPPAALSDSSSATTDNKQQFWLGHTLTYSTNSYVFFDRSIAADSAYYGVFATDPRGLRQFVGHRSVRNEFRLLTFRPTEPSYRQPRRSRGLLEVGIDHQLHWLDLEATDSTVQNLFLTGKWNAQLGEILRLESNGHFGLFAQAGDYRVEGTLFIDLDRRFDLQATFINQLYTPSLIQDRFWVSEQLVWDNDFRKTLETSLTATLSIPDWQLRITGGYHLLNNFIYYDAQGLAQQSGRPVSIGQLAVEKNFRVGKFHLDNLIALQAVSEDVLRLPEIHGRHSLYFAGKLFKVLDSRMGFDLRYNSDYFSDTYQPVTGNFRLQNEQLVSFYPSVDAFFSLRVTKFRAFVRWFNLTGILLPDQLYYQTAFYPYPPGANLRIGIDWRFTE